MKRIIRKQKRERILQKDNGKHIWITTIASLISTALLVFATVYAARITTVETIEYTYKEIPFWDIELTTDYFPLKEGNRWIYEGEFVKYSPLRQDYVKGQVELEVNIEDVISKDGLHLFIFSNFITNVGLQLENHLEFNEYYEKIILEKNRTGLLLVANKIFLVNPKELEGAIDTFERLGEVKDNVAVSFNMEKYELIMELPLFKGQRFGDMDSITRPDIGYFWYVNSVSEKMKLVNNTFQRIPTFELIQTYISGYERITFTPYQGIDSYDFRHSGGKGEVSLSLKSFEIK
ncbi:hypothetical protein [Alkalihalobacillus deserti]|uniref:hypothetical protein n=1 Tax=Alkalihalobacillus deserti TaxID=2879466 RepID=UPI001D14546A|nr:hypothetical protein [Alkalihalobacillus deserti]